MIDPLVIGGFVAGARAVSHGGMVSQITRFL
jgi:hypothetical protein